MPFDHKKKQVIKFSVGGVVEKVFFAMEGWSKYYIYALSYNEYVTCIKTVWIRCKSFTYKRDLAIGCKFWYNSTEKKIWKRNEKRWNVYKVIFSAAKNVNCLKPVTRFYSISLKYDGTLVSNDKLWNVRVLYRSLFKWV